MGQRRQTQKLEKAWSSLAHGRARMMALPLGERVVSLAEVEQQAVQVFDEAHSYYRQPASRRVMHSAATLAHQMVEKMDVMSAAPEV